MNFLNVLYNPSSTREVVVEKYNSYVNMLLGLVKAPGRHERENKEAISLIWKWLLKKELEKIESEKDVVHIKS